MHCQIWELCDPGKTNQIGRDAFYKSLALSSLAQKGKTIDEKVFSTLGDRGEVALIPFLFAMDCFSHLCLWNTAYAIFFCIPAYPACVCVFTSFPIWTMHGLHAELPSPSLASPAEIQAILTQFFRATKPTELGYTYEELKALDEIKVTLIPEKKGTLLKHTEYTVESRVRKVMCGGVTLGLA